MKETKYGDMCTKECVICVISVILVAIGSLIVVYIVSTSEHQRLATNGFENFKPKMFKTMLFSIWKNDCVCRDPSVTPTMPPTPETPGPEECGSPPDCEPGCIEVWIWGLPGGPCCTKRFPPLLYCASTGPSCTELCQQNWDVEQDCAHLTECDDIGYDIGWKGICNDLKDCDNDGDCKPLGHISNGLAERECRYNKRCYAKGEIIIT